MPVSLEERIMQAIQGRLALVRQEDGYENTLLPSQRFQMGGNDFRYTPTTIIQFGEIEHLSRSGPNVVWERASVLIAAYVRHSPEVDPRSTDALLISLDADIYTAVMTDRLLGGLVKDMWRHSVFLEDVDEPVKLVGHVSEFMVKYAHESDSAIA